MATNTMKLDPINTAAFDDAFDNRPEWALECSMSEYHGHLASKGWTPQNHVWSDAAVKRRETSSSQ